MESRIKFECFFVRSDVKTWKKIWAATEWIQRKRDNGKWSRKH
jgi:hypothetical protein